MVCEEALLEALVKELIVRAHHIVYCVDVAREQALLQLVEVGLEHLYDHIVDVVLAEVEHAVTQSEGLLLDSVHVKLLRRLVQQPNFLQVALHVLAVEEVAEYQLVLDEGFLG